MYLLRAVYGLHTDFLFLAARGEVSERQLRKRTSRTSSLAPNSFARRRAERISTDLYRESFYTRRVKSILAAANRLKSSSRINVPRVYCTRFSTWKRVSRAFLGDFACLLRGAGARNKCRELRFPKYRNNELARATEFRVRCSRCGSE